MVQKYFIHTVLSHLPILKPSLTDKQQKDIITKTAFVGSGDHKTDIKCDVKIYKLEWLAV